MLIMPHADVHAIKTPFPQTKYYLNVFTAYYVTFLVFVASQLFIVFLFF